MHFMDASIYGVASKEKGFLKKSTVGASTAKKKKNKNKKKKKKSSR